VCSKTVVLTTQHKAKLGPYERRENAALSLDRVLVENFFGRLQEKFAIMNLQGNTFRPSSEWWIPIGVGRRRSLGAIGLVLGWAMMRRSR
jgi:hypothetical protein